MEINSRKELKDSVAKALRDLRNGYAKTEPHEIDEALSDLEKFRKSLIDQVAAIRSILNSTKKIAEAMDDSSDGREAQV